MLVARSVLGLEAELCHGALILIALLYTDTPFAFVWHDFRVAGC